MARSRDIVIAGGGMVGVSLALQLGAVLPAEINILLVESFPLPKVVPGGIPDYHPSFDSRSTALSYSSRVIYERMQVWDDLQQWLCPIKSIHVSSRGRFGSTVLRACDHDWTALGYVAENGWLGNALIQSLYRQGRVEVRSPGNVVAATPSGEGVRLQLQGDGEAEIDARLLLVADGADSQLCTQLGVAVAHKDYRQHALVANIASAQPHRGFAYERFTDEGPLALLPLLAGPAGEHRSALVWTLPPQRAQELSVCPQEEFLQGLQASFGYRLGRLMRVGARHTYPLALLQSSEQVRQGVVVMGNAAHALHPVAGQGYNLALRDVAELSQTLLGTIAAGLPLGDVGMLGQYLRRQQPDQERTIHFSDRIPALFMHADPVLGLGRDLALAGLDVMPALKREFVRQAAGVAGLGGSSLG